MTATVPDFFSDQSTLTYAMREPGNLGDTLIPHYDGPNKLTIFHQSYTAPVSGNPTATEVISMGFLPQGLIIPHLTGLISSDFGSNGTIDVGLNEFKTNAGVLVAADPDEFWDDLDISGQDVNTTLAATGVTAVKYGGFNLTGYAEVLVTLATAGMQAGAQLHIYWAMLRGN